MTKKHFVALAAALADLREDILETPEATPFDVWHSAVCAIARVCAADNPRFDSQRFYAATEK